MVLYENLKFSARSALHCPSKRSQKQIADAFKQKIATCKKCIRSPPGGLHSLCFQSQRFIRPTTMAT